MPQTLSIKWLRTLVSFLLIFVIGIIIINACRKTDQQAQENTISVTENKFFNEHRSDDPIVQTINIYFKKFNNKHQFVGKTVNQIGFPYWDKSIIFRKPDENSTGRGNSEDSVIVTYIPFVRDSQQFVNASLLVRTTPSDTSFQYLCDWQYAEFGFDTVQTGWNARNVFHVFAMLDRSVFSRNKFRIIDQNLLTNQEEAALSSAGINFDSTEVVCTYQPLATGGRANRNNILYEVLVCEDYSTCLEIGTGSQCLRQGRANYGPFGCCLISVTQTICTTVWVDIPGSGNGGGNGSGSGGSGGGSGGGGTPPECGSTLPGRTNLTDSCGPGWVPDPTYSTEDPCIKLSPFTTDSYYINAFTDLKNKANPNAPNPENREYIYKYQADGDMIGPVAGEPNKCEIEQKTMFMLPVKAYMHSHYPGCPEPIFSPGEIQLAFDLYKTNKVVYPFVFAVATAQGNYVMVINDPTAFDDFGSKYFLEDSPKDPEDLTKVFKTYKLSLSNSVAQNEKLFLDFLKGQNGTGIELLKANSGFTQYEKLTLSENGQLIVTPCI